MNHRGRFQAQGKTLEESNNWSQKSPLLLAEGQSLLNDLKSKLNVKDLKARKIGFIQCEAFMERASENGGINVKYSGKALLKSFPSNNIERVDLEIHKGIAFIIK